MADMAVNQYDPELLRNALGLTTPEVSGFAPGAVGAPANVTAPASGTPMVDPAATPNTAAVPQSAWDKISAALANPGFQSMLAQAGAAMLPEGHPMRAIAGMTKNIGDVMQYNNAMKKTGLGGVGSALANGANGNFQNSSNASGGGLGTMDVLGLPIDVVKQVYTDANRRESDLYKRGQEEQKSALDVYNAVGNKQAQEAQAKYTGALTDASVFKTRQEKALADNVTKTLNLWATDPSKKPEGLDAKDIDLLRLVEPKDFNQVAKEIMKPDTTLLDLGGELQAYDKKSRQIVGTFKKTASPDAVLKATTKQETEADKAFKINQINKNMSEFFYSMAHKNLLEAAGGKMDQVLPILDAMNNKVTGGINTEALRMRLKPDQVSKWDAVYAAMLHASELGLSVNQIRNAGLDAFNGKTPALTSGEVHQPPTVGKSKDAIADAMNMLGYSATPGTGKSVVLSIFPQKDKAKAAEVIQRESGGNPQAVNINTKGKYAGTVDHGLFQINDMNVPALIAAGIIKRKEDLYDPILNAKAADWLNKESGGKWRPWRSSEPKQKKSWTKGKYVITEE